MASQTNFLSASNQGIMFQIASPQPIRTQFSSFTPYFSSDSEDNSENSDDQETMEEILNIMKKNKKRPVPNSSNAKLQSFVPQRNSNPKEQNIQLSIQDEEMDPLYCKLSRKNTLNISVSTADYSDSSSLQQQSPPSSLSPQQELKQIPEFQNSQKSKTYFLQCNRKLNFQESL